MTKFVLIALLLTTRSAFADDCVQRLETMICEAGQPLQDIRMMDGPDQESDLLSEYKKLISKSQAFDCNNANTQYVSEVVDAYQKMPQLARRLLCQANKIVITAHKQFNGYFQVLYDINSIKLNDRSSYEAGFTLVPKGFNIWLSTELFNQKKPLSQLRTESNREYLFSTTIPKVLMPEIKLANPSTTHLSSVIVHELGHALDYSNNIADDWAQFSFRDGEPKFTDDNLIELLESRGASGTRVDTKTIITYLNNNGFLTLYSRIAPTEDFADTFQVWIESAWSYVDLNGKVLWNSDIELRTNPITKKKGEFIKNITEFSKLSLNPKDRKEEKRSVYFIQK